MLVAACARVFEFCNHGRLPGSKTGGKLVDKSAEFCNHGKPFRSKTSPIHSVAGSMFCDHGKSLSFKTYGIPQMWWRTFCNCGKSLGPETEADATAHPARFCNHGKSLGSKTDGPVFRVLPAVLWILSDVKPRLFRPFATRSRPFSNDFSETFLWSQTITAHRFGRLTMRMLPGKLPVWHSVALFAVAYV